VALVVDVALFASFVFVLRCLAACTIAHSCFCFRLFALNLNKS
jgi:hypothetical protein